VAAGVGLAVLTGVLGALALPPVGWWPLIFVAFVPTILAQHRVVPARWSGVVFGLGITAWLVPQITPQFLEAKVPAVYELLPLIFGGIAAGLAWRSRRFHERTAYRWFVISPAVGWVAVEWLRLVSGRPELGGTWWSPAYPLYRVPSLLQPLTIVGVLGLELLVMVVNYAVATAIIARIDGRTASRRPFALTATAVAAWVVVSVALMGSPPSRAPRVRVAAIETGTLYTEHPEIRVQRDEAQTRAAAAQGAQLAVWSEAGLKFDPNTTRTAELRALARQTGTTLVVGYGYKRADGRHLNEVVVIHPDGTIGPRYGKNHYAAFAGDYSSTGGTYPVQHTAFGTIGTVICYDLDFTDTARHMARNGARLIATPSSDPKTISATHWTHLVFRAIENRVPMVKADTGADSVIVDAWGRVLAHVVHPGGRGQATLVDSVALGSGHTFVNRVGDWPGWVCLAAALGFIGIGRRRARAATVTSGAPIAGVTVDAVPEPAART
jgi:apolipoprotein N-acyltransferase